MKVTFEPLIIMFSHALFLWWLRVALWTSQVRTERERKKKPLLWTPSVMLSMLLTTHCVTRHVIWNYGVKELTFNLDATILHRKLSVLYLLSWCWVTLRLNQPRERILYLTSSPQKMSLSLSLQFWLKPQLSIITTTAYSMIIQIKSTWLKTSHHYKSAFL